MKPITYNLDQSTVLQFTEDLDAGSIKPVKDLFEHYASTDKDILIDLKDVHFIDSSGVGAIVFLYKRLIANGRQIFVIGLHGQPQQLFDMLQLSKNLKCFDTIPDYLKTIRIEPKIALS